MLFVDEILISIQIHLGQIWGNLISSTVFAVTPGNTTEDLDSCGANFDPTAPAANNSNLDRPEDEKVGSL